jgi:hypothetical protein
VIKPPILGCGHLSVNEDKETGECMHEDCNAAREERRWLNRYDSDGVSVRERSEVLADEKRRIG